MKHIFGCFFALVLIFSTFSDASVLNGTWILEDKLIQTITANWEVGNTYSNKLLIFKMDIDPDRRTVIKRITFLDEGISKIYGPDDRLYLAFYEDDLPEGTIVEDMFGYPLILDFKDKGRIAFKLQPLDDVSFVYSYTYDSFVENKELQFKSPELDKGRGIINNAIGIMRKVDDNDEPTPETE